MTRRATRRGTQRGGRRAHAQPSRAPARAWRLAAVLTFAAAGVLFLTSAQSSRGSELRATSVTDLSTVVRQQRQETDALLSRAADLNREVGALTKQATGATNTRLQRRLTGLRPAAGITPVRGAGIEVVLDDAPEEAIDEATSSGEPEVEQLIVHQQDLQAVVNTLWSGGARAVSIMDQRIISTTGIKCVGNTVILHKRPFAPPYRIKAVGEPSALLAALDRSAWVTGYRLTARRYGLGYTSATRPNLEIPGYAGPVSLRHAQPLEVRPTPRS